MVYNGERSGRPSVIADALKQKVNRIIRHFTISEVYEQCPEVSRTVVYEIVTEHLQYGKICSRWVPRRPGGNLVRGGNNKLVSRYDNCPSVKGNYVEK